MSAKPDLQPTLQALLDRDRRALDEHPTPEALVAYHAGELPSAEQEDLRNHLILCHDCADLLLDLVSFAEFTPPGQTPALADGEVESAWQKLQPRLVAREEPAPEPKAEERMPAVAQMAERRREREDGGYQDVTWRNKLRVAYALAASLLIGVLGLSLWGTLLQKKIDHGSKPQVNVKIADAYSDGDQARGSVQEEAVRPGQERFVLLLHPTDIPDFPSYSAIIRLAGASEASGAAIDGLVSSGEAGAFTLELPGQSFPPGSYEVVLYGVDRSRREKVDRLTFKIAP